MEALVLKTGTFNPTKTKKAGSTHPKLAFANGMRFFRSTKYTLGITKPKKSGMLNKKVTNTTPLNTFLEANLSGSTFKTINTMVMGYKNIKAGTASIMIKPT